MSHRAIFCALDLESPGAGNGIHLGCGASALGHGPAGHEEAVKERWEVASILAEGGHPLSKVRQCLMNQAPGAIVLLVSDLNLLPLPAAGIHLPYGVASLLIKRVSAGWFLLNDDSRSLRSGIAPFAAPAKCYGSLIIRDTHGISVEAFDSRGNDFDFRLIITMQIWLGLVATQIPTYLSDQESKPIDFLLDGFPVD